jgi:hypothetical protein
VVPRGNGGGVVTDVVPAFVSIVGAVIVGIRRIFYVFQRTTDVSLGALELTFADGRVIVLDSGADGESLVMSILRWEDPFLVGVMSSENRLHREVREVVSCRCLGERWLRDVRWLERREGGAHLDPKRQDHRCDL